MSSNDVIQAWNSNEEKLLKHEQVKIDALLKNKCFRKIENMDMWVCFPIPGYNKTHYILEQMSDGFTSCSCQGFNSRQDCTHVKALLIFLGRN